MPLVRKNYPMYDLALACGEVGGILPTALNAASEVAVNAFLNGQIAFTKIYDVVQSVIDGTANKRAESYAQLAEVDLLSRGLASRSISKI